MVEPEARAPDLDAFDHLTLRGAGLAPGRSVSHRTALLPEAPSTSAMTSGLPLATDPRRV